MEQKLDLNNEFLLNAFLQHLGQTCLQTSWILIEKEIVEMRIFCYILPTKTNWKKNVAMASNNSSSYN